MVEVDVIIFLVDVILGVYFDDCDLVNWMCGIKMLILVVFNKVDNFDCEDYVGEFFLFGFG